MPPGPIIKGFQVIKGDASGLCACLKGLTINAFAFETVEKALHSRIIVTIRRPTHAHDHRFLSQKRLIAVTGVGTATVRMVQ